MNSRVASIQDLAVSAGDVVTATGVLQRRGQFVHVVALGEGHYARILNGSTGPSVATDLSEHNKFPGKVTVQGIWSDAGIADAHLVDDVQATRFPETIADRIDPAILPPGRMSRTKLLAPEALAAADAIRGSALLSYSAHRQADGWIGIASASDPMTVTDALASYTGDALTVTSCTWTSRDLDSFDSALDQPAFADDLLEFGRYLDPRGRFRATALFRVVTHQMASVLESTRSDAFVANSWLRPV